MTGLREGACVDLLPEVVDKYFGAGGSGAADVYRPFEYQTAKAICGQCAVRGACLADAISDNSGETYGMMRAGESAYAIREMRRKYVIHGVQLDQLVDLALSQQDADPKISDLRYLREGRFPNAELVR